MINWIKYNNPYDDNNLKIGQCYLVWGWSQDEPGDYYWIKTTWGRTVRREISNKNGLKVYEESIEKEWDCEYYFVIDKYAVVNEPND